jgi:proline iminopeptidase
VGIMKPCSSITVFALLATITGGFTSPASAQSARTTGQGIPRTSGMLTIGATPHPFLTEGTGQTCIVVGLAPSYAPLFSDRLKQRIRFVYVDFKNSWNAESPRGVAQITMDTLLDEIDQVRTGLGLPKACLIGHSAPGLIAMEYSLRHPERVSHVILVSVEPCFTRDYLKARTAFWELDASAERKAVYARNLQRVPDELLRTLSPRDAFALRYARTAPQYFYDPSYDFYWAFSGRQFSAEMISHYVSSIIADYDPRPRLANNSVPILLVLGKYDYNIPYHEWDLPRKTTPHLTSHLFERSAHFPMIEEGARFDEAVLRWLGVPR